MEDDESKLEDVSAKVISSSEKDQLRANNEVSTQFSHMGQDQSMETQAESKLKKQQHIAAARHKVTTALNEEECDDKVTVSALKKRLGELQAELPAARERAATAASSLKKVQKSVSEASGKLQQSEGSLELNQDRLQKLSKEAKATQLDVAASEAAVEVEDQADHRLMQREQVEARVGNSKVQHDEVNVVNAEGDAAATAAQAQEAQRIAAQLAAKEEAELSEMNSLQNQTSRVQQQSADADTALAAQEQQLTEESLELSAEKSKSSGAALTEKDAQANVVTTESAETAAAASVASNKLALKSSTDELGKLKAELVADELKVKLMENNNTATSKPDEDLKIEKLKQTIAQQDVNVSQLDTDASMLHIKSSTDAINDAEEKRLTEIAHEQMVASAQRLQQEQRVLGEANRATARAAQTAQNDAAEQNATAATLEQKIEQQKVKLADKNAALAHAQLHLKGSVVKLGSAQSRMKAVAAKARDTESRVGALSLELTNTQRSLDIVTTQSEKAVAKRESLESDQVRLSSALSVEKQQQHHAQQRAKDLSDATTARDTAAARLNMKLNQITRSKRMFSYRVSRVNETANQLSEELASLRIQKALAVPQLKEAQVIAEARARATGQNSPLQRVAAWATLVREANTTQSRTDAQVVENKTREFWTTAAEHPLLVSLPRAAQSIW